MPMSDWLTKYPRVAALLQRDDDVLEGVSAEEAPDRDVCQCGRFLPRHRPAWHADVAAFQAAFVRELQAVQAAGLTPDLAAQQAPAHPEDAA